MGIFRASVDPDELIVNTPPAVLDPHTTVYDPERGGHFPADQDDD